MTSDLPRNLLTLCRATPHFTCGFACLALFLPPNTLQPLYRTDKPTTAHDKVLIGARHGLILTLIPPTFSFFPFAGYFIYDGIDANMQPHSIVLHCYEEDNEIWTYDPAVGPVWSLHQPLNFKVTAIYLVQKASAEFISCEL